MKKPIKARKLLDPLLHRCSIGHLTYTCCNPDCASGRWPSGERRFVEASHFDETGCCREHPEALKDS